MATRLVLVGGFLGAGKTTLLLQAARLLTEQGLRVGLVTNDQGQGLVDTALADDHNIPVTEVAGGCFCCRFPDLLDSIRELQAKVNPDIIIGEPVGSCTDLVATILEPLSTHYPGQFELAPLTILRDHHRNVSTFPTTVSYLYDQQLAEADIIILSKRDLLRPDQVQAQIDALSLRYPDARVISLSSRTGEGLAEWLDLVRTANYVTKKTLDLDYTTYAEAEACLGWLNTKGTLVADQPFSPTDWIDQTFTRLEQALITQGASIAHMKIHLTAADQRVRAKASSTQIGTPLSWDQRPADALVNQAEFTLNARVGTDPYTLESLVRQAVPQTSTDMGIVCELCQFECFSPLPPKPTFRLEVG
jgi:G3E family GTPase